LGFSSGEEVLFSWKECGTEGREKSKRLCVTMAEIKQRKLAEQVYQLCKQIPQGKVTTYKEIAMVLEMKGYQAIGQVLRKNPYAPTVPCHRVVKSNGSLGGFKGCVFGKEITEKQRLLKKEGVIITENKIDLGKFGFRFL